MTGFLFPVSRFLFSTLFYPIDILACPECGSRLRLLATIEERAVVERLLKHLGLPVEAPSPAPVRSPPWLPGFSDKCADE